MEKTGVFRLSAPIEGLGYTTLTHQGITNENGEFRYEEGEDITFSIGRMPLGATLAKEKVTPADITLETAGKTERVVADRVTNICRLLLAIDPQHSYEDKIVVAPETAALFKPVVSMLLSQSPELFEQSEPVKAILQKLGAKLVSPARARNYLRRTMDGIVKKSNVRVPTRDGAYTLADIFLPEEPGRYPVIISFAGYGKAFWLGTEMTEDDMLLHDTWEDEYFSGKRMLSPQLAEIDYQFGALKKLDDYENPQPPLEAGGLINPRIMHISEYFERANTRDWVPRGYVCMYVDSRGLGEVPGKAHQFGRPEIDDFYDAIEWAGTQPWSNGKVGTYGASYYAMNAFSVASTKPPHLAAMLSFSGDSDFYRDNSHFGGMSNSFTATVRKSKGEWDGIDHEKFQDETPFDDPELFNDHSDYPMCFDPKNIDVPFYTQSAAGICWFIHSRGTNEVFRNISTPKENKHMDVIAETGIHFWMFNPRFQEKHFRFFDYWLKGEGDGIADEPLVNVMVRTGWSGYYLQGEDEWPIARTEYRKLHLATTSDDYKAPQRLCAEPVAERTSVSYPAEGSPDPQATTGPTFVTDPLDEDMVLIGNPELKLFASSTSTDMRASVIVRALDENGDPVSFEMDPDPQFIMSAGALKLSHRKEDPERSTAYRPYHTHLKEDYQPLEPGEIVEATVEILPTTARLKKGWRLAVTVQPDLTYLYDPFDDYSKGATYTLYTGGDYDSYLQIPVIPDKQ